MPKKQITVIGHRGAMGYAPENTMASFQKASELGVDAVELDIKLSADKKIVVVHDENLQRLAGADKVIGNLSYSSLRRLDVGKHFSKKFKGERIPLLEDVLKTFGNEYEFYIEIKNGPTFYKGIEKKLIALLKRLKMIPSVTVISFDHRSVLAAKELEPALRTGVLHVGKPLAPWVDAEIAGASILCSQHDYVTRNFIADLHNRGFKVYAWVCNTKQSIQRVVKFGADAVCSDYPDLIRKVVCK